MVTQEALEAYCRQKGYDRLDTTELWLYNEIAGWTMKDGRKVSNWRRVVDMAAYKGLFQKPESTIRAERDRYAHPSFDQFVFRFRKQLVDMTTAERQAVYARFCTWLVEEKGLAPPED